MSISMDWDGECRKVGIDKICEVVRDAGWKPELKLIHIPYTHLTWLVGASTWLVLQEQVRLLR